jgi:hypothetical protein
MIRRERRCGFDLLGIAVRRVVRRRWRGIEVQERKRRRGNNVVEVFVGAIFDGAIGVGTNFAVSIRAGTSFKRTNFTVISAASLFATLLDPPIRNM